MVLPPRDMFPLWSSRVLLLLGLLHVHVHLSLNGRNNMPGHILCRCLLAPYPVPAIASAQRLHHAQACLTVAGNAEQAATKVALSTQLPSLQNCHAPQQGIAFASENTFPPNWGQSRSACLSCM